MLDNRYERLFPENEEYQNASFDLLNSANEVMLANWDMVFEERRSRVFRASLILENPDSSTIYLSKSFAYPYPKMPYWPDAQPRIAKEEIDIERSGLLYHEYTFRDKVMFDRKEYFDPVLNKLQISEQELDIEEISLLKRDIERSLPCLDPESLRARPLKKLGMLALDILEKF